MSLKESGDFSVRNRLALWIATGLGIGCVSPAPGTVGGLWGIPLAWAIDSLPGIGWQIASIVAILLVSVGICNLASKLLCGGDPQEIVLDEIAVLPIVYLLTGIPTWHVLLAGWILFRLFDITKPPPVQQMESLPAGWGIMADDFVAALYACVSLRGLVWLDNTWRWGLITTVASG